MRTIAVILVLLSAIVSARTTHVRQYTRKDGTVVRAHERRVRSAEKAASAQPKSRGRTSRSAASRHAFQRQRPCPSTGRTSGPCPGYVIDHINPLACGGADSPSNMQWQTTAAAKAKDLWERNGCRPRP